MMAPSMEPLLIQAERIRDAGVLGRGRVLQLFDYLVGCAASGRVPKEVEVAIEVFGKYATADLSQDASVRVCVHNLRRKLNQFYSDVGRLEPEMITLPKGEYRLVVVRNPQAGALLEVAAVAPADAGGGVGAAPARAQSRRYGIAAAIALALVLGVGLGLSVTRLGRPAPDAIAVARASGFWAPVLAEDKPILLVVGDYYIFGDTGSDMSMNVTRLIRDFTVNSKSDLQHYLLSQPQDAQRYQDVSLSYLPTSSAYALANLMPVLAGVRSRLKVTLASELTPAMIKSSNLVYVGLLSGMGALQSPAFSASRFQFGDSFDELIDRSTRRHYVSQAVDYADDQFDKGGDAMYRDYGYLSSFAGPVGNRVVVIAGMQDEGLRQTIDFLTDHASLDQLAQQVHGRSDFEGLLEVSGMNHLNLSGRLLLAAPLAGGPVTAAR